MKRLLLALVLGVLAVGCSNDCDDAVDKLEECGQPVTNSDTDDCSGAKECYAGCVNDASCADLKSEDPNNSFWKCALACGQ
jgi:hypothetical protein